MMFGLFKNRRRQRLLQTPLPDEWRQVIEQNVAVFRLLSAVQQSRVAEAIKIIAAERHFVGSGGLKITDEIKVTIAAQAALLLLGEDDYYFDRVPTIYVYPRDLSANSVHDLSDARLVEEDVPIDGQVLEQGEIRLSWDEILYGGGDAMDGENVVLHEFAHHLDSLDGELGGTPPLANEQQRQNWIRVFDGELARLRVDLKKRRDLFLHEEAAENRAELFAYGTEVFFEQPRELHELHPELFECLLGFYKTDPRNWFV